MRIRAIVAWLVVVAVLALTSATALAEYQWPL